MSPYGFRIIFINKIKIIMVVVLHVVGGYIMELFSSGVKIRLLIIYRPGFLPFPSASHTLASFAGGFPSFASFDLSSLLMFEMVVGDFVF